MDGRDSIEYPHGTWARYREGCRCNRCQKANEIRERDTEVGFDGRRRRKGVDPSGRLILPWQPPPSEE